MPGDPAVVSREVRRFGVPEALAELRRHGLIDADAANPTPLPVDGEKAIVAVERGAGQRLVVKIDRPGLAWPPPDFCQSYFLQGLRP